jgi:hypothetical protein
MLDYYEPTQGVGGAAKATFSMSLCWQRDAQLSGPSGVVLQRFGSAVTLGEACWITITHPGCRWGWRCYILHVPMLTARCAAVGSQRGRSCCALEAAVTLGEAVSDYWNPPRVSVGLQMLHSHMSLMLTARCRLLGPSGPFLLQLWGRSCRASPGEGPAWTP